MLSFVLSLFLSIFFLIFNCLVISRANLMEINPTPSVKSNPFRLIEGMHCTMVLLGSWTNDLTPEKSNPIKITPKKDVRVGFRERERIGE